MIDTFDDWRWRWGSEKGHDRLASEPVSIVIEEHPVLASDGNAGDSPRP